MYELVTFLLTPSLIILLLHGIAWFLVKDQTDAAPYQLKTATAGFLCIAAFLLLSPSTRELGIISFPFLFLCIVLITFFTDSQTHLISRFTTVFLVPFVWIAAYFEYLPVSFYESLLGSFLGFFILWTVGKIAFYITKKESLGQGDSDLLCFIGSFLGPLGMWITLLFGSIIGSLCGAFLLFLHGNKARSMPLPFGSFLVVGAITVLYIMYDIIVIPFI